MGGADPSIPAAGRFVQIRLWMIGDAGAGSRAGLYSARYDVGR
jgi:hypothetical protein